MPGVDAGALGGHFQRDVFQRVLKGFNRLGIDDVALSLASWHARLAGTHQA